MSDLIVASSLKLTIDQFAEGKIHGWLDFYKSDVLDTEHLWYCTYWAKYEEPAERDYDEVPAPQPAEQAPGQASDHPEHLDREAV